MENTLDSGHPLCSIRFSLSETKQSMNTVELFNHKTRQQEFWLWIVSCGSQVTCLEQRATSVTVSGSCARLSAYCDTTHHHYPYPIISHETTSHVSREIISYLQTAPQITPPRKVSNFCLYTIIPNHKTLPSQVRPSTGLHHQPTTH